MIYRSDGLKDLSAGSSLGEEQIEPSRSEGSSLSFLVAARSKSGSACFRAKGGYIAVKDNTTSLGMGSHNYKEREKEFVSWS